MKNETHRLEKLMANSWIQATAIFMVVTCSFFLYIAMNNLAILIRNLVWYETNSQVAIQLYGFYCKRVIQHFTFKNFVSISFLTSIRVSFLVLTSVAAKRWNNQFLAFLIGVNSFFEFSYVLGIVVLSYLDWDIYYFSSPLIVIGLVSRNYKLIAFMTVGLINVTIYHRITKSSLGTLAYCFIISVISFLVQVFIIYLISGKVATT